MIYFLVAETIFQTELAIIEENLGAFPDTFYTSTHTLLYLIDRKKAALALEEKAREDREKAGTVRRFKI